MLQSTEETYSQATGFVHLFLRKSAPYDEYSACEALDFLVTLALFHHKSCDDPLWYVFSRWR